MWAVLLLQFFLTLGLSHFNCSLRCSHRIGALWNGALGAKNYKNVSLLALATINFFSIRFGNYYKLSVFILTDLDFQ